MDTRSLTTPPSASRSTCPQTTASFSGQSLEVWGDARAAHYAEQDTGMPQQVYIQFQTVTSGTWTNVQPVHDHQP